MQSLTIVLIALLSVAMQQASAATCPGSQEYQVRWYGLWNAKRHPVRYPSNAHWSPSVVAVHTKDSNPVWDVGTMASPGLKQLAETGGNNMILGELGSNAAVKETTSTNGPLFPGMGETENVQVTANEMYPSISLATMLAPSPDLFAGGMVNMCDEGTWGDFYAMNARLYDAGTDSGPFLTSDDMPLMPQKPVRRFRCNNRMLCRRPRNFPKVIGKVVIYKTGLACDGFPARHCPTESGRCKIMRRVVGRRRRRRVVRRCMDNDMSS